jgi:hypothetical protein
LSGEDLLRVAARIAPTNIVAHPAQLLEATGLCAAVANPSPDGVRVRDGSVCLGGMFGDLGQWWRTGSAAPDGTYALLRYSEACVELLSDVIASRTIWYVADDQAFLASTSQRALVALLGELRLNRPAVSWLLSSGTLGPEASWDIRLTRLPGGSCLTFDRATWRARVETRPVAFAPVVRDRQAHVSVLREALTWSCTNLNIDVRQWVLPLSGGRDSRALLAFMVRSGLRPRCITWTTKASAHRLLSDASVARLVARRFGVEHELVWLDGDDEEPAVALDRFIAVGEGRSDEFSGYTDGCRIWRDLFDDGVSGVIRGDESVGIRRRAVSADAARTAAGAGTMVSDYPSNHLIHRLDLAEQVWPERLRQQPGEGLEAYRDRMYEQSHLPDALAPLNALKGRYVEVVNPLLSRRMIGAVHELPDEWRAYGRAYAQVVDAESRPIPYARFPSTPAAADYLRDPGVVEAIVRELTSVRVERVLGKEEALHLLAAMAAPQWRRPTLRGRTIASLKLGRAALPQDVARRLTPRYSHPEPLSPARLGWRATIASRMVALLEEDAALLCRTQS